MPTFRNSLSVPSSYAGKFHLPMEMEPIVSSETSAIRTQTPGNYPKSNKLHLEHGESLKTRMYVALHVQYQLFLSYLNGSRHFSTDFFLKNCSNKKCHEN